MSLISFRIKDQKGLRLAECTAVPPLMIICGPNGSGKSTLLDAVKRSAGERELEPSDTTVLYQPPHRAIRRQSVQRRWLGGPLQRYGDLLSGDQVSGFEGLQVPYPARSPDNVDESGSTIKFVLGKLENKRQNYIASRYDSAHRAGETSLPIDSLEDIFAPLGEVVSRLLPHLAFERIDFENEDNVKCVFVRTAGDGSSIELDLDDLSSGEKSVVLLFLPLIEAEIHLRLEGGTEGDVSSSGLERHRVFLLDEPELHLHPDLQRRMLAFMRERSASGSLQFILVTHSPTILDEAGDDELYILRLPDGPDVNQLRQVASSGERLAALRELTGESFFVATGRNIVCLEGEPRRQGPEDASDLSIIESLHPRASRYTFISMGGRSQVEAAVRRLQAGLPAEQYGVAVAGLVDGDRTEPVGDGIIAWPVCEFENLLLDPPSISAALVQIGEHDEPTKPAEIDQHLRELAELRRDAETQLRVKAALPLVVFRPSGATPAEIRSSFESAVSKTAESLEETKLNALFDKAGKEVDAILKSGGHLSRFKGKELLRALYGRLGLVAVSYEQFLYAVAQQCKSSATVIAVVESAFNELDKFVDDHLSRTMLGKAS